MFVAHCSKNVFINSGRGLCGSTISLLRLKKDGRGVEGLLKDVSVILLSPCGVSV
jgi:hypothetical protein